MPRSIALKHVLLVWELALLAVLAQGLAAGSGVARTQDGVQGEPDVGLTDTRRGATSLKGALEDEVKLATATRLRNGPEPGSFLLCPAPPGHRRTFLPRPGDAPRKSICDRDSEI